MYFRGFVVVWCVLVVREFGEYVIHGVVEEEVCDWHSCTGTKLCGVYCVCLCSVKVCVVVVFGEK